MLKITFKLFNTSLFKLKSSLFFVNKRKLPLIRYKISLKLCLIDINRTIKPLSPINFEKNCWSGGDLCNKSAILLAQRKQLALLARI